MTRYIFLTSLIVSGVILSGFFPILLPVPMVDAIRGFMTQFYTLRGFLPVTQILIFLNWCIWLEVSIACYNLFKWLVGN